MKWRTRISIVAATAVAVVVICHVGAGGLRIRKSDVPKAIANLKTGSPEEKAKAAETLGRIGSIRVTYVKSAIPILKKAVTAEKDPKVRAAAAKAIGYIGVEPKATFRLLFKTLKTDKSNEVKIAAMLGMAKMPREAKAAMGELRKMSRDKDKKNRQLSRTARNVMRSIQMN